MIKNLTCPCCGQRLKLFESGVLVHEDAFSDHGNSSELLAQALAMRGIEFGARDMADCRVHESIATGGECNDEREIFSGGLRC